MNNTENQQTRRNINEASIDEVTIHGTYPYDDESQRWRQVRVLSVEEASQLTGVPMERAERNLRNNGVYLWLNKGYIVLGAKYKGISALSAGLLEAFGGGCNRAWPVGTQAVYLHDGFYSLIERY